MAKKPLKDWPEQVWLSAKSTNDLLLHHYAKGRYRKWRLFGSSCASRALVFISDHRLPSAIVAAERYADGDLTWEDIKRVRVEVFAARKELRKKNNLTEMQEKACNALLWVLTKNPTDTFRAEWSMNHAFASAGKDWHSSFAVAKRQHLALAFDIFENPFRPVIIDPSWLTSTVVAIASGMYAKRDFSPMPILADALQDAGCEHEDILNHCRGPGPHVKGCWVVDLILRKE